MLAIWRAVQEEKHCRGAKSLRQACTNLYEKRADFLIKIIDEDGKVIDVIKGISGAATLWQRYQAAEKARHDKDRYPILHARAEHLLKTLPGTFERVEAARKEYAAIRMKNDWLS